MTGKICVVLSAYNGEKYLQEQVESLFGQTVCIDRIHIRDDGSSDTTPSILRRYASSSSNFTYELGGNVGWKKGFPAALASCEGYDWYAFCDQDDVWLPRKIEAALNALAKISDPSIPCLYAGNVMVVDEYLTPVSKFNEMPVDIADRDLPKTLSRDCMAGGLTYVFNAKAREMLLRYPYLGITGHDRILMLICKTYGAVTYDFNPYVLYRQHESNVFGALTGQVEAESWMSRQFEYLRLDEHRAEIASGLLSLENLGDAAKQDKRYLGFTAAYKNSLGARLNLLVQSCLGGESWKQDVKLRIKILLGTY